MYYKRNIQVRSRNHCCRGKAIGITHSECVSVTLVRTHIIALFVACPALTYFSTLSHKRHDFRGWGVTEYKTCVLIFSVTFAGNISRTKTIQRDTITNAK